MDHLTEHAVTILRRDGRASYIEIARRLNSDRTIIASRLAPLFQDGSLRVTAAVHPRFLGLNVLAHVSVRVMSSVDTVANELIDMSEPVFISETTGRFQLVLELHLAGLQELHDMIQRIRGVPRVTDVEVALYEHMIASFFLGEEPEGLARSIDPVDLAIIRELQEDGRLAYAELGRRVNVSTSTARSRVQSLLESGVMQIGAVHGRDAAGSDLVFGLGVVVRGSTDAVVDLLLTETGLELLARAVGRYSVIATVAFSRVADLQRLLLELREIDEVQFVDQWLHVRILREQYHHDAVQAG
ncbi:DNA-binding Lrp family transcriptional regulator [Kibdelosporangium banguiense]|uniref:DNA-binding Lrp family transcriptional regulator n=1 Tax=Kibdelosporangium banguiense TaxID=1365924 RepID=A0ABS4TXV7_9PSEU|nr:AsnC family transcriptional regulator [Kibdelosporangium banguiense]MBP2329212.1 DNA-binding Lrp family transcriptional regulator [Kibdelosporangium banguiense]